MAALPFPSTLSGYDTGRITVLPSTRNHPRLPPGAYAYPGSNSRPPLIWLRHNMIELINQLDAASSLLDDAIQQYLDACSAVKTYYQQTTVLSGVPRTLSDRVAVELLLASSYEENIGQAKSLIGQARNCSPIVAPIHSLPNEVLTRIFHFVVGTRPCEIQIDEDMCKKTSLPKYPDFLSHVCSRWRRLTMALPGLWSHIDIVNFHSTTRGFIARANEFATRAIPLPLHIHIRVPYYHEWSEQHELSDFLATAAPQMGSLELLIPDTLDQLDESILQCCLENCSPGQFTELIIKNSAGDAGLFLEAAENQHELDDGGNVWLNFSRERFENIMKSMTVLRLDGLYPLWTSRAYEGLEELRLTCDGPAVMSITKSELSTVFTLSPQLRFLKFGLHIADEFPEDSGTVVLPLAHLGNLEVLDIGRLQYAQLNAFLGLLGPCLKPLQLTITYEEKTSLSSHEDEVCRFFKTSNITRLWVKGLGSGLQMDELSNLLPHLRVLALSEISDSLRETPLFGHQHNAPPTSFGLDALYMFRPAMSLENLSRVIGTCPARRLVLWMHSIRSRKRLRISIERIRTKLSMICPDVAEIPNTSPNLIEDWDYLA